MWQLAGNVRRNNRIATFETKKGKTSEAIIEIISQQQNAIDYKLLLHACGGGFSETIVPILNTNVSGNMSENIVQSFVWHWISVLDLAWIMVENASSHTHVLPNIECIFTENLSIWESYPC